MRLEFTSHFRWRMRSRAENKTQFYLMQFLLIVASKKPPWAFTHARFSGRQVLKKMEEFQLIILDIRLRDTRGYDVTSKVREQDDEMDTVMITGCPNLQDSIDALDVGIRDILLKPIDLNELL